MTLKDGESIEIEDTYNIGCQYDPKKGTGYFQCYIHGKTAETSDKIVSIKIDDNIIKKALMEINDEKPSIYYNTDKNNKCVLQNDYDRGTDSIICTKK